MITDKQHLEADIWLEEQSGGCVHKNIKLHEDDEFFNVFICACGKVVEWAFVEEEKEPPVCTPRSKDLGAVVGAIRKLKLGYSIHNMLFQGIEKVYANVWKKHTKSKQTVVEEADHPSPQHAAAWGLYLVLREVKK